MKRILGLFAVLMMFVIVTSGCGQMMDRVNPFIDMDEYYVLLKEDGKKLDEKQWEYELTGYNKDGDKQEFVLLTSRDLRKDAYLKVFVKGRNGKSFVEVQENEVPEKALAIIKK
ncbi:YxeA family protein [Priestia taiwanensis]|uniref:YxeA family protein n=1 Tax=Priestia taiwanensis TaxID=1347902 RepID=A0A917AQC5_9BACI|nr:YxeA family protein [Priestia taiwanensis]MBM7363118.1 uncharacterized protein (TIGR01655 family) [Priestia taiwanensis]GGE67828.1 hypothetical protein GCM10007140_17380 [Priestia taiwanensis]